MRLLRMLVLLCLVANEASLIHFRRRRKRHHHSRPPDKPPREELTQENAEKWLTGVMTMKASGEYDKVSSIHGNQTLFSLVHKNDFFLPWHRWYLHLFEEKSGVTLPYWDWSKDAGDERNASVFSLMGGFGECVLWQTPCITRIGDDSVQFWNRSSLWQLSSAIPPASYRIALETGPHAVVHLFMKGTMTGYSSPDDPIFWLHHAYVDLLWTVAQDVWGDPSIGISESYLDQIMPGTEVTPRDVLSPPFLRLYRGSHYPLSTSRPVK